MSVTPLQRKRVLEAVKEQSQSKVLSIRYPLGRFFTMPHAATTTLVTQWAKDSVGQGHFVLGLAGQCPMELESWGEVMDVVQLYLTEVSNNSTWDTVVDIILWRRQTVGS